MRRDGGPRTRLVASRSANVSSVFGSGARDDGDALGSVAVVCVWLVQDQGPRGR